ncbi:MAG: hypothetical protein ACN0LA_04790 [Candidatus Longimicrobiales bacterium M2_2A_002]
MRETDWLLVSGAVLFAAGAAIMLVALTRSGENLVAIGLVGLVGAVVCLAIGSWRMHAQVDWERIESEQRLWESGPLGRTWLRIRKALFGRR